VQSEGTEKYAVRGNGFPAWCRSVENTGGDEDQRAAGPCSATRVRKASRLIDVRKPNC
jgi:hypothetical protein